MMEIDSALRKFLLTQDTVKAYTGTRIYKNRLMESLQGTAGRAVVVRIVSDWATPDRVKSMEYPIVQVECWADPDRDEDGNITVDNALDKARAVWRVIRPLVHNQRDVTWGTRQVIGCHVWRDAIGITPDTERDETEDGDERLQDQSYVVAQIALVL